jgi:hypothetical protein
VCVWCVCGACVRAFGAEQFAEHWVHVAALGDLRYDATDYPVRHDVSDVVEVFDELAGVRVENFTDGLQRRKSKKKKNAINY